MHRATVAVAPYSHTRFNSLIERPLTTALLIMMMAVMFSGVFLSRYSPDESQWIYTTRYMTLFRQGDFASPEWDDWTHTQPPLARYVMGDIPSEWQASICSISTVHGSSRKI